MSDEYSVNSDIRRDFKDILFDYWIRRGCSVKHAKENAMYQMEQIERIAYIKSALDAYEKRLKNITHG